ncbi:MAG: glycosyltransferase [Pedobacter sp.]|nr:MAG: glycosyltransferase [Pedobacter sp.]
MKVLILTHRVPFPANSGYPIVVYNTIKGLLSENIDITLFSLNPFKYRVDVDDIYDPVFEKIHFDSRIVHTDISLWGALLNIFSNESYNVSRYFDEEAAQALENILREHKFDVVQFEGLYVAPYLSVVKSHSQAKLIYRAHSIESEVWEKLALREKFNPKRRYIEFLARRLKNYELDQINRFDQVFAISEQDRQSLLKSGSDTPMEVFPVALDFERYKIDAKKTIFPTLFHLGAMDMTQNKEGLSWFLDEIWPDIEKLSGDLRFYIAGKHMPQEFFDYDSDNLIVEGEIFDAVEFMNSKAIMIVPLLSGSGMRVKIIEGMAMEKCIIATTIAAEGIQCEHGKDILLADSPDEFYRHILQCLTQPHKWRDIGVNARQTVVKNHDILQTAKRMVESYKIELVKV